MHAITSTIGSGPLGSGTDVEVSVKIQVPCAEAVTNGLPATGGAKRSSGPSEPPVKVPPGTTGVHPIGCTLHGAVQLKKKSPGANDAPGTLPYHV